MKLYFMPGACSLAPHIALREAGIDFEAIKVGRDKKASNGEDFLSVNPKGYVPALRLDNGEVLTEGPAILPYIADLKPAAKLAPPAGTIERTRLHEWLSFLNSEVHKAFGPLFTPGATDAAKEAATTALTKRFDYLEQALTQKPYLLGEQFSVADIYAFVLLGWTRVVGIDLGKWPGLAAFHQRIGARPNVVAALRAEGLTK
jgi:glutathione S-transferase